MKFIIGKKIEMTQVWKDGKLKAVTKIQASPCVITQIKNEKIDGYNGIQLGFGDNRKEKNIKKPQLGHLKKIKEMGGKINFEALREFRITSKEAEGIDVGDIVNIDTFDTGDMVGVTGISKGKGFAGVVKRHGFKGSKKTHGNKDQLRMPGSIGATGPAHVFKGTRMGGRMGTDRVTTKNIELVEIDKENNILLINGPVPGARNSLVLVIAEGELKIEKRPEIKKEETKEVKNTEVEKSAETTKDVKKEESDKGSKQEEVSEKDNKNS